MPSHDPKTDDLLIEGIHELIGSGGHFDANLDTDERVLARITDGIYRQPASALRELVANAYDADAKVVSITTDSPRFSAIKVSDDGIGMGPEALANLVLHIGGSAKRTQRGPEIGITSKSDPSRSIGGRRLIGKIGVGLFSVAQLTRQFTIITKTANTNYQLLAHVTLNRFDESEFSKVDKAGNHSFRAGQVRIWAEKTPDKKGHGTTIHLTTLLPRVVHILQSRDVWAAIQEEVQAGGRTTRVPPLYHIGQLKPDDPAALLISPSLPWTERTSERDRFPKLLESVSIAWERSNHYARLEHAVDNYFQALWSLGLSLPLKYVDKHPFDLSGKDATHFFELPQRRGTTQLAQVSVGERQTIGSILKLPNPTDWASDFTVAIDGVDLARPIRFKGYPHTDQALQGPVMFVGNVTPDMSAIPESQRGGPLSFSAYFYWTPRVIPQEHNGLLIRINGASGTLFDPTFLKYQVGERRIKQLIAEVFVHEGLDGALNIDRESFNTAHPHYQVLANWVHNSLRLIRNTLKALQAGALDARRAATKQTAERALTSLTNKLIREGTDNDPSDVPQVILADDKDSLNNSVRKGNLCYLRSDTVDIAVGNDTSRSQWAESHIIALARLMQAYGVLDDLDRADQARLIAGIVRLFTLGE